MDIIAFLLSVCVVLCSIPLVILSRKPRSVSVKVITPAMEKILREVDPHKVVSALTKSPRGTPVTVGKYTFRRG